MFKLSRRWSNRMKDGQRDFKNFKWTRETRKWWKDNLVPTIIYKNLTLITLDLAFDRADTIDLNEQRWLNF